MSALFSDLAFASVGVALFFQQREMRDQQRQISRQLFENTFFGMIRQHNEIVASYRAFIAKHDKELFGRDGIQMVRRSSGSPLICR